MADAKTPPDLSVDEILATIRRIIADDEQATAVSTGTVSSGMISPGMGPVGTAAAAAAGRAAGGAEDDRGTGNRVAGGSEPEAEADDVLELTDALNEDGTIRRLAPIGGGRRRQPEAGDAAAATVRAEAELRPRPSTSAPPNLRLSSAATGAPIGEPAGGQREPPLPHDLPRDQPRDLPRDLPLGGGERTLEDLVRDTLRPLLQAWIDENLPPIVERLVQAEIARVAREAGAA